MVSILSNIQEIGTETMGQGAFPASDIEKYVSDPDSYVIICYGPERDMLVVTEDILHNMVCEGPIYGFCIGGVYTKDRVDEELYAPVTELHDNTELTDSHYPIAYYRDTAVHPNHQSQGVGTLLTTYLSAKLMENVDDFITPIWHRHDGNMQEIIDNHPIDHLHTFRQYDLHDSGDDCPVCPDGEACTCTFSIHGLLT